MNGQDFAIVAYVTGLALLWGYALHLYLAGRAFRRRAQGDAMNILLIGLSHRSAPLALRGQLGFSPEAVATALLLLRRQYPQTEAAIISTCNRVELLVAADGDRPTAADLVSFLAQARDLPVSTFAPYLYQLANEQAVRHILRVTAGLDSMVIGDYQVVNQIKQAYTLASEQGTTGRVLNRLFHHALACSKRLRSETEIGRLKVSVPSIALDVARQVFDDFASKRTLVIGSGETAQLVCELLRKARARDFVVVSRTTANARMLAEAFNAQAVPFEQLDAQLVRADIVLTATRCPRPFISIERVRQAQALRHNRLLFCLDLAVPRNVEPGVEDLPQVVVYDLDALGRVALDNQKHRAAQLTQCEAILDEQVTLFQQWLTESRMAPLIAQMYADARALRDAELARLLEQCPDLTPEQRAAVTQTLERMTSKFMHPCAATLRQHQGSGAPATLADVFHALTARLQGR